MNRRTEMILTLTLALALIGLWTLAAAEETKPAAAADPAMAAETTKAPKPEKEIQWQPSYEAAMAKAKETGKPVMIDFYTDWCGWCKVLDQKTYTDPKVIEASDKMLALKIDAEKHPDIAKKYNVTGYPHIAFLSPEGKVIHTVNGFKPPDQFLPDMKAVLKGKSPAELAQELMKKGTDDPEEQLWIGEQLLDDNKPTEALPWLEKAAAKLPDEKKLQAQRILPSLYAKEGQKEKADKAFEAFKNNPKAEPEDVADAEVRFAYQLKDRKRMESALDRVIKLTKDEAKKNQVKNLRSKLDELFPEAPKPAAASVTPAPAGDSPSKPADGNK